MQEDAFALEERAKNKNEPNKIKNARVTFHGTLARSFDLEIMVSGEPFAKSKQYSIGYAQGGSRLVSQLEGFKPQPSS